MSQHYLDWCKQKHVSPYITKITRDTLGWKNATKEPQGGWHKGDLTSLLCRWFQDMCEEKRDDIDPGSMLASAQQATLHLNSFLRMLYSSDVFIEKDRGLRIASLGRGFLRLYKKLAIQAFRERRPLFPLLPKAHSLDHIVYSLTSQCVSKGFGVNPMVHANQQDEDFIGKASRLSRKVSPRRPAERTVERYLIAARDAWRAAGMIQ
jgi:hypothetical protein